MSVDWYDDVELIDGRKGCVIEIYKDNTIGDGYEIELSNKPNDSETVTVTIDKIKRVIRKNNA